MKPSWTFTPARYPVGDPATIEQDIRRKLAAVRTPNKRAPKIDAKALEAAGERALTRAPAAPLKRQVVVRIYYRSMGDEILACDTEPMSPQAAQQMRSDVCAHRSQSTETSAIDATIESVDGPRHLDHNARLVVFPSQMHASADQLERAA